MEEARALPREEHEITNEPWWDRTTDPLLKRDAVVVQRLELIVGAIRLTAIDLCTNDLDEPLALREELIVPRYAHLPPTHLHAAVHVLDTSGAFRAVCLPYGRLPIAASCRPLPSRER